MADLIERKRTEPDEDLLTAPIAAHDGHDKLSEDELVTLAMTVLAAEQRPAIQAAVPHLQPPGAPDHLR